MTDSELDFPIDDELRELAGDYLNHAELPAAHVDRAYEAFSTQLAAAPVSAAGGLGMGAKLALGTTLVGALGLLGFALQPGADATVPSPRPVASMPAAPTPDQPSIAVAKAPSETTPKAETQPAPVVEPTVPTLEAAEPETAPRPTPKKRAKPSAQNDEAAAPAATGARAELLLLERARQAMRKGDGRTSLELLDEHAERFPKGRFSRERDATRVAALCSTGSEAKARNAARRFVERHGRERAGFDPDEPCRR